MSVFAIDLVGMVAVKEGGDDSPGATGDENGGGHIGDVICNGFVVVMVVVVRWIDMMMVVAVVVGAGEVYGLYQATS